MEGFHDVTLLKPYVRVAVWLRSLYDINSNHWIFFDLLFSQLLSWSYHLLLFDQRADLKLVKFKIRTLCTLQYNNRAAKIMTDKVSRMSNNSCSIIALRHSAYPRSFMLIYIRKFVIMLKYKRA